MIVRQLKVKLTRLANNHTQSALFGLGVVRQIEDLFLSLQLTIAAIAPIAADVCNCQA